MDGEQLTDAFLRASGMTPTPDLHVGFDPGVASGDQTTIVVGTEGPDGRIHYESIGAWRERGEREALSQRAYDSNSFEGLRDILRGVARDSNVIEGQAVEIERRPERLLDAGGSEP